jgi:hypothetical protein
MLEVARQALDLSCQAREPDLEWESACTLAGLEAFAILLRIGSLLRQPALQPQERSELAGLLDDVDRCAGVLRHRLLQWGNSVESAAGEQRLPTRLLDTAFVLMRTGDALRGMADRLGLADPRPRSRLALVGAWTGAEFAGAASTTVRFEVSALVAAAGGSYQVGLDFADSAYGTQVERATLVGDGQVEGQELAHSPDCPDGVSIWERWAEVRLEVPARPPGTRVWLELELSGLPVDALPDRRTCAGSAGLRQVD